jgi:Asp-tRNA(Asn)/Glu-tRNA(Gln) amidotransferase C subunit
MDKKENLEQLMEDLNKILNLFKKMEKSSLDDVISLKKESNLLTKELKDRYGEKDSPKTDSQEA